MMRHRGQLIAFSMDGHDPAAERDLGLHKRFPIRDNELRAHAQAVPRAVKKYGHELAAHGFSKEDQGRLVHLGAELVELMKTRSAERGEARAARAARDAMFEQLRYQTSYFRRLGRAALINSPARSDFDRIKRAPKAKAGAPEQQQVQSMAAPAMAASAK